MRHLNFRCLIVALALFLAGCRSQIQHGLDERDANEVVTALVSRGFDARKVAEKGKKPTWAVELDDEHATDALRVLSELKLPRPPRTTTREVTSQVALIETPAAERLRQMEALEGDIEQMLEGMDGVASAGVELVVPAAPRPGQLPVPSKASALLRVHPASLERLQQQREAIRALIAGSVEGLKADDVVVMIDPVTSQVTMPAPVEAPPDRLRLIVIALGVLVTALAMALVALGLRLRRHTALVKAKTEPAAVIVAVPPTAPRPTPAPGRPVVNPAVQRRVA
jgi:type III secretion protein J